VNSGSARLRAAVVGLGDIARKAYLPALAARADLDLVLCTRDRSALDAIGDAYRLPDRHTNVDSALESGVDLAFVHVATAAHVTVVTRFLDAGVPTFVDKPLAYTAVESARLVDLARARATSLMVGFNRRFAPPYLPTPGEPASLVSLQKNRLASSDEPRRVVFDDFIHVIDTLRFLAPEARLTNVHCDIDAGRLRLVAVLLSAPGVALFGSMNRDGGRPHEVLDLQGRGWRRVVSDIAQTREFRAGHEVVLRRGDWTPVHVQRGFTAMCDHFIDTARRGEVLDATDALRTHEKCEQILGEVGSGV
jgi:virulence factor